MSGQVVERATSPGDARAGSIYDLGYQHYQGRRLGRVAAFSALYVESLRSCYGLGRPARSKVVPVGLLLIALVPAAIAVAIEALAGGLIPNPIRYDDYFSSIVQILVLFVAAQGPELVGRDQRSHVLSLYFSRPLDRIDYALAKLGALATALLVVTLTPQAVIFAGKVLVGADLAKAFGENVGSVPPILFTSVVISIVMAGIALAVGAYTPRRAYATGAIFALFYVTLAIASTVVEMGVSETIRYIVLISPTSALEGLTAWAFDAVPNRLLRLAGLPAEVYVGGVLAMAIGSTGLLLWRYRRIGA